MGLQDLFNWRSQTQPAANTDAVGDDEPTAEVDEPPDNHHPHQKIENQSGFQKSAVRSKMERKESLLTKALLGSPEVECGHANIHVNTPVDLSRRRSMVSNASMASTAELTSDGGLTSPARTNTPSPPPPGALYASFAPYSLSNKAAVLPPTSALPLHLKDVASHPEVISVSPKTPAPAVAPKKRCITFACRGDSKPAPVVVQAPAPAPAPTSPPLPAVDQPKQRKISFFCDGKASEKAKKFEAEALTSGESSRATKKGTSRSPSIPRKSPRASASPRPSKNSFGSRRGSQSPVTVRVKPKYIIADEKTLQSFEATRFHEFAREEQQEDDWIRNEVDITKKMTVNDTLKKENAIRQLGNEAEEEAMEEDEEEEDEGEEDEDDENEDEDDEEEDDDASDGNETDNEAGFAESDDSDFEGEFAFWTPGRNIARSSVADASIYRPSAHRAASMSSIDSASNPEFSHRPKSKNSRRRAMKIRPGTPELPDSTDFVCGTLDEDRPMENAYISCMAARKNAKHKQTPQDIDPSFPTSDPENEEDDEDPVDGDDDSEDHIWLHGKFEDSEDEGKGRRRSIAKGKKSPALSPRRLHSPPPPRRHHSPPPPKHRHRSPPARKLFGQSPRRMRSPPPARAIYSPAASPTHAISGAIDFMPLASRPGLTHTKSLPRAPNAFGRQYKASRIEAAAGNAYNDSDGPDGHVRGAIDIVKGLEQKRQRRREKFLQKHCNRKAKSHAERKPQPGKGAERMRELGLLMAGKNANAADPYMMSA